MITTAITEHKGYKEPRKPSLGLFRGGNVIEVNGVMQYRGGWDDLDQTNAFDLSVKLLAPDPAVGDRELRQFANSVFNRLPATIQYLIERQRSVYDNLNRANGGPIDIQPSVVVAFYFGLIILLDILRNLYATSADDVVKQQAKYYILALRTLWLTNAHPILRRIHSNLSKIIHNANNFPPASAYSQDLQRLRNHNTRPYTSWAEGVYNLLPRIRGKAPYIPPTGASPPAPSAAAAAAAAASTPSPPPSFSPSTPSSQPSLAHLGDMYYD